MAQLETDTDALRASLAHKTSELERTSNAAAEVREANVRLSSEVAHAVREAQLAQEKLTTAEHRLKMLEESQESSKASKESEAQALRELSQKLRVAEEASAEASMQTIKLEMSLAMAQEALTASCLLYTSPSPRD